MPLTSKEKTELNQLISDSLASIRDSDSTRLATIVAEIVGDQFSKTLAVTNGMIDRFIQLSEQQAASNASVLIMLQDNVEHLRSNSKELREITKVLTNGITSKITQIHNDIHEPMGYLRKGASKVLIAVLGVTVPLLFAVGSMLAWILSHWGELMDAIETLSKAAAP